MLDRVDDPNGPNLGELDSWNSQQAYEMLFFVRSDTSIQDWILGLVFGVVLQRWLKAQSPCTSLMLYIS